MGKKRSTFFLLVKFILLQTFTIITLKFAPNFPVFFLITGVLLVLLNYFLLKDIIYFKHYLAIALLFFACGFLVDLFFSWQRMVKYPSLIPPLWIPMLWMIFYCYYGDIFNKMLNFSLISLFCLGAIGGGSAYYRGLNLLDISYSTTYMSLMTLFWGLFTPFTIKLFRSFTLVKLQE